MSTLPVFTIVLAVAGIFVVIALVFLLAYRKVSQGEALVINKLNDVAVKFTGGFYIPYLHRVEIMDISVKTIQIERSGKDGLICSDNIRADIKVTFFVRVNKTREDVRKVAQAVGCDRASDQDKIEELFAAKFSEALKTVGKQTEFEDLYGERVHFREQIINVIGEDLNGYILEDAAIDYLEQTPVDSLDDENVLDSQGIRKITQITSEQRVHANELRNKEEKEKGKDNLETKKAILEYERQEADAEAKQQREIKVVQSQQQAQAEEIQAQEQSRAEKARIEAQEEVEIRKIDSQREQEVANKNRERVLAVEEENVQKERQLQEISRERETELKRIDKNKEVETEQKDVAEAKRDRIAVEKTVAEEEESIKELRKIKEAEREKEASVIKAEGEAQEKLIADIKQAEAQEKVAEHESREEVIRADAEVDCAERISKAKKQRAEGVQAEQAAPGLAEVQVKEADAQAKEKEGMVEAKVTEEQMKAEAAGMEEQEMVEVRIQKERATAVEKEGMAEAKVKKEQMMAEAAGTEEQGMVDVRIKQENAEAVQKEGEAEANVVQMQGEAEAKAMEDKEMAKATGIREKMAAEADGLAEKAKAIESFDEDALAHEEFRMELEMNENLDSQRIENSVEIARAQADVMAEAFGAADINIVGGNDGFYDKFINSISAGHVIEGFMDSSPTARNAVNGVLGSEANGANGKANGAGNLSDILSAVQGEADGEGQQKIQELIEMVEGTDLDSLEEPG